MSTLDDLFAELATGIPRWPPASRAGPVRAAKDVVMSGMSTTTPNFVEFAIQQCQNCPALA